MEELRRVGLEGRLWVRERKTASAIGDRPVGEGRGGVSRGRFEGAGEVELERGDW